MSRPQRMGRHRIGKLYTMVRSLRKARSHTLGRSHEMGRHRMG